MGLAAAAVLVPALFLALFERQARRLEALADHGVVTEATVVSASASRYTDYAYVFAGERYTWNVSRSDAPFATGSTFPVRVLPEAPSFSRPGATGDAPAAEALTNRAFFPKILLGMMLFFAGMAAFAHRQLGRLERGEGPGKPLSPRGMGHTIAFLMWGLVLSVNAFDDVRAVQSQAFGARPFGLPVTLVVSLAQSVLFVPYFWVMAHAMMIVDRARRDGASLSKVGLLVYLARVHELHPDLIRSRTIVSLGVAYFGVLAAAWIAYANHLGI